MSFQKFMRSLFKVTEGVKTPRCNKPKNSDVMKDEILDSGTIDLSPLLNEQTTREPAAMGESPEPLPFIRDAEIQGTPWFVDLMQGLYNSSMSILPPESWILPDGVKSIQRLDLDNANHMEMYSAFQEAKRKVYNPYFEFLLEINENKKASGDPDKVGRYVGLSLSLLQPFVKYQVLEDGSFLPKTIPAIEVGGEYYLEKNMMGQFKNLLEVVENIPELHEWKESLLLMLKFHKEVKEKIKQEPGIQQKDIKKLFGEGNEGAVQKAIYILENQGKVERRKKGSTYELFIKA